MFEGFIRLFLVSIGGGGGIGSLGFWVSSFGSLGPVLESMAGFLGMC